MHTFHRSQGFDTLLVLNGVVLATLPFVDRASAAIWLLASLLCTVVVLSRRSEGLGTPPPVIAFLALGCVATLAVAMGHGDRDAWGEPAKFALALIASAPIIAVASRSEASAVGLGMILTIYLAVGAWFVYDLWITRPFAYYPQPEHVAFNQRVMSFVLIGFALISHIRKTSLALPATMAILLTACAAGLASHSEAAKVAFGLGCLAGGAAILTPRAATLLCIVAVIAAILAMPVIVTLIVDVVGARTFTEHGLLAAGAGAQRIEIWSQAVTLIAERPLFGWGLDNLPREARLYSHGEHFWTHPHNMFLQIWLEFGAMGAVATLAAASPLLLGLARLPSGAVPPIAALVSATLLVMSVGHGFWQSWWHAILLLTAVTASPSVKS